MTFYLSGAGIYGVFLLLAKLSDKECSKTDPASWLVLAIASALWVVVAPISLIEVSTKLKQKVRFDPTKKANLNQKYIETVLQAEEFESNTFSQLNTGN